MKYLGLLIMLAVSCMLLSCSASNLDTAVKESATPLPNQTITSTSVPTQLPTLKFTQARRLVQELLDNNAGCQLPCWWGITPGETKWIEAQKILEQTSIAILERKSGDRSYFSVQTLLPYPYDFAKYLEHSYVAENGIVEYISVHNYYLAPKYYLPKFLETYGQPTEIWIRTFSKYEMGLHPFLIDLYYQEQGILIEYSTGAPLKEADGKLLNCLIGTMDSPLIFLWSPNTHYLSFDEAKQKFLDTESLPEPKPLFETTGMDVVTFYETFMNPASDVCLETDKSLWP